MAQQSQGTIVRYATELHGTTCDNAQFQLLRRQHRISSIRDNPLRAQAFFDAARTIDNRVVRASIFCIEGGDVGNNNRHVRAASNFTIAVPFGEPGTGLYEHSIMTCPKPIDICLMVDHDFKTKVFDCFYDMYKADSMGKKELMLMEMTTAEDINRLQEGKKMEVLFEDNG